MGPPVPNAPVMYLGHLICTAEVSLCSHISNGKESLRHETRSIEGPGGDCKTRTPEMKYCICILCFFRLPESEGKEREGGSVGQQKSSLRRR